MSAQPIWVGQWEQCPPGQLQRIAQELKAQRQRRRFYKILGSASGLAVAALTVGLVWHQLSSWSNGSSVAMTCEQVRPLLVDLASGKISDSTLVSDIMRHLAACPPCTAMYQRLLAAQKTTHILLRPHRVHGVLSRNTGALQLVELRAVGSQTF